jgi:hypothetical protein
LLLHAGTERLAAHLCKGNSIIGLIFHALRAIQAKKR